jgi:hypothetical protein
VFAKFVCRGELQEVYDSARMPENSHLSPLEFRGAFPKLLDHPNSEISMYFFFVNIFWSIPTFKSLWTELRRCFGKSLLPIRLIGATQSDTMDLSSHDIANKMMMVVDELFML